MICRRLLQSYCCNVYIRRNAAVLFNSFPNNARKNEWKTTYALEQQRGMAGHSKWSNIKHIKAANDNRRSLLFTKLAVKMKHAIQLGKSNDPKVNDKLATAIADCRRAQMPVSKIETLIKGGEGDKPLLSYLMEAKGPAGCLLLIDFLTTNVNRSKIELRQNVKKSGFSIVEGNARHAFDFKGTIEIDPKGSKEMTLENAVDLAIEVGAEDVQESTSDDGKPVLLFLCEPKELSSVKNNLLVREYEIVSSALRYLPKQPVTLPEADMNSMEKFCALLDERDDVVDFYVNIQ